MLPCLRCTLESHATTANAKGSQIVSRSSSCRCVGGLGRGCLRSSRRVPGFAVSPPEHTVAAACHLDLWQKQSDIQIIGLSEKEDHFIGSFLLRVNWD